MPADTDSVPTDDRPLLSDAALATVRTRLRAGAEVRQAVPGGRLHIDRRLPFLLVHRRPPFHDPGTATLVLASPAYIVSSGDPAHHQGLLTLLDAIAQEQRRAFGAFLLIELWAAVEPEPSDPEPSDGLDFRIVAPTHGPLDSVLEELETALLTIDSGEVGTPRITVDYTDAWAPPGLAPLEPLAGGRVCRLGVEAPAVFRDAATGATLPFELRQFRHDLSRALKRATFTFIHDHTPLRPAHFHELGRQSMTADVYGVDAQIAEIALSLDLLLHVTPVNATAAESEYLGSTGPSRAPEFLYRARTLDPDMVKRRLYAIPIERIEDPTIAHIFLEKRDELDRQLGLVADRNTPRFLLGSRALYGDPEPELVQLARLLLDRLEPPEGDAPLASPQEVAERAERELDLYRAEDPTLTSRVELRDDIPGVMVSSGNLLIGTGSRTAAARVDPLLAHEIGTHVLTHHNGRQQPLRELYGGMAGYDALQEGLAVLWEYLVGGLDNGRMRVLGARVLAARAVCDGADFVETHRLLTDDHGLSASSAFGVSMRIHRGGGFIKDVIYLRGLTDVLGHLASGGSIDRLHVGKVAHSHLGMVEELLWRDILKPPRLLPHHRSREDVKRRLAHCSSGVTVLDLIEGG